MRIPKRLEEEGLVEYAERVSEIYVGIHTANTRKLKGQFFTPKQVSKFMANLFEIHHTSIRLLDPGAGAGVLTAAFCEKLQNYDTSVSLTIDLYEKDPEILPFLEMVLDSCKRELEKKGHSIKYNIYKQDFIPSNEEDFKQSDSLYDFVISNPPYYKLRKEPHQSTIMNELISGQPNIYTTFMALSASMLKTGGEMVFITPRSFCSGSYYKKFRGWFLSNTQITNIHIFESRKEIFDKDKVLQENVIIKAKKIKEINRDWELIISISKNKNFDNLRKIKVKSSDVIYHKDGRFIRIPTSYFDVQILRTVDSWSNKLCDLGLEISTGPVVPFRATQYLLPELTKNPESAPLLWMHNIQDMKVVWPVNKNKKESAIQVCDETKPLLLPVKNYILLKRFSSKEQTRRLYAAVLLDSEFHHKTVGIENHVNYIHKSKGDLSIHEALGIAAILNTAFIDNYFRSLNGNTQVNATEIRSLPFPKIEEVEKIGKLIHESQVHQKKLDLDGIVSEVLGISTEIIKNVNKGESNDEQNQ